MISVTNDTAIPPFARIISPSTLDALRHIPYGQARRCVSCSAFLPTAHGEPASWIVDGMCLRCALRSLAAIATRQHAARSTTRSRQGAHTMSLAYVPDQLADDASMPLKLRVLIELQRRGAALDWTRPISASQIARQFERSRAAVSRALSWAVSRGYLERQYVSLPTGGRGARYRLTLERTAPAAAPGSVRQ